MILIKLNIGIKNRQNMTIKYELGKIYEFGKGVLKNEIRAFYFYRQSAEKGYTSGMYKLGYYYLYGIIVDSDKKKALDLYKKAAKGGNNNVHKGLVLFII